MITLGDEMPRTPDGFPLKGGPCFCNVEGQCVNQQELLGPPWCECYCHEREYLELEDETKAVLRIVGRDE